MQKFIPPPCPDPASSKSPSSYRRRGRYQRLSGAERIPDSCGRCLSSLTFRNDYCHHKPGLNLGIVDPRISKVSQRQLARNPRNSPLPIQHPFAMPHEDISRLVRRNWGYTKPIERTQEHSSIYAGDKNDWRPRTEQDQRPSAASELRPIQRRRRVPEAIGCKGRFSLSA